MALQSLQQLNSYIHSHENIRAGLFNSSITNTGLCAAFIFEIVKWLRKRYWENINSIPLKPMTQGYDTFFLP
jgi:hypothetical protein